MRAAVAFAIHDGLTKVICAPDEFRRDRQAGAEPRLAGSLPKADKQRQVIALMDCKVRAAHCGARASITAAVS